MIEKNYTLLENYCSLPFVGLALTTGNGIQPCCNWSNRSEQCPVIITDRDTFNHEWMHDLRKRMLDNQVIPGCISCKNQESINQHSMRTANFEEYGYITQEKLVYLDYNLGNLCNLKCRMCDGSQSSSWHSDEIALGWKSHSIQRHFAAHTLFDLSELKRIRFVGGEPMMEQNRLIEILCDIKASQHGTLNRLIVSMQTNGTVRFNDDFAALISECRTLELTISIDGLGKVNDYQRTGYDWDRLEQNLRYFNDTDFCAQTHRQIDSTLTLLNINNYPELYSWISAVLPKFNTHAVCITYPNELRICNIPYEYKQTLKSRFLNLSNQHRRIILAELYTPCMIPIEQIQKRIIELDLLRGEDFANVDPEMYAAIFP